MPRPVAKRHIAQVNIARLRYPLSDTRMIGMASRIDEMNLLAENSPGFVWRYSPELTSEDQRSLFEDYIPSYDANRFFFNMSVWVDIRSLREFVFKTVHSELLKNRDQWVEETQGVPTQAMWWIEPGKRPTVQESLQRLDSQSRNGPSETVCNDHNWPRKFIRL